MDDEKVKKAIILLQELKDTILDAAEKKDIESERIRSGCRDSIEDNPYFKAMQAWEAEENERYSQASQE